MTDSLYNPNLPGDTDFIADGPKMIRDNQEALRQDEIVNAGKLQGLTPGNEAGNIPVSNGSVNAGLNAEKLDGKTADMFAAAGHRHTVASGANDGFMSNTDKAKLDGVQAEAEVNQMAFSKVMVGGTAIEADSKTDTLELATDSYISLTPDSTNDRITISLAGKVPSAAAADTAASAATAQTAAKLSASKNIALTGGVTGNANFDGSQNISIATNLTAHTHTKDQIPDFPASLPANGGTSAACSGNAATASRLQTARTINGVSFDGSSNIIVTAAANGGNAATVGGYTAGELLAGSRIWISGEYTPVINTPTIVNHGLSINPENCIYDVRLRCKNAEQGYSVGDYAISAMEWYASGYNISYPILPALTSTTIQINTGAGGIYAINKGSGVGVGLTVGNWRYVFRIFY